MNEFQRKVLVFAVALKDVYLEEDSRELPTVLHEKNKFTEENLTEDFTCMLYSMMALYMEITNDDIDIIDFISILNRLAIQHIKK